VIATRNASSVVLRVPDAGFMPAHIASADAVRIVVVLATPPAESLQGRHGVLEYTTPRGMHRVEGRLQVDPARPEVVAMRPERPPEIVQRREWVRVDAVVPAVVHLVDAQRSERTTTLNVSGNGVLLGGPRGLPIGTAVVVEMTIAPGEPPLRMEGTVARLTGHGEPAIHAEDIDDDDHRRLLRFVTERERAALRVASLR
jgi:hypothetical protein